MKLYGRREAQGGRVGVEAIGGGGVADAVRLDADPKRMIAVGYDFVTYTATAVTKRCLPRQPITSLALSLTASTLLVGTAHGAIHLYDVASHQLLRALAPAAHKGLAVTGLAPMLKPPDLIGHASLSMSTGGGVSGAGAREGIPVRPVASFQRTRDAKTRAAHELPMMLPGPSEVS